MLLNDQEIYERLSQGMIVPAIKKLETKNVLSYGISSFGYDLRLSDEVRIFDNFFGITEIDPKRFNPSCLQQLPIKSNILVADNECWVELPGNSYALGHTIETITIPDNVLGICLGKSTYARSGLIVNTTPAEPGWKGQLVLELYNTTPVPMRLYINEGIAQMIFLVGVTPTNGYSGRKYQNQQGIVTAKI